MALFRHFLPFNNLFLMKTKIALALSGLLLVAILWMAASPKSSSSPASPGSAPGVVAQTVGDKQVIEITVKEGYQPREVTAKAGVPLVLKMKTAGTFDCSTAFSIPKLGIHERFEATGEKNIEIPAQKAGDTLTGVCGMGMFSLVIKFT